MKNFLLFISFLIVAFGVNAQQIINSNTTWSGNVFLSQKVIVNEGVTLIIEAGTNVQIAYVDANGDNIGDVEIIINGEIKTKGIIDCKPILFSPLTNTENRNYWKGISINSNIKNDSIIGVKILNANIPFNINSDATLTSIKVEKFGNIGINYDPSKSSSILNLNSIFINKGETGIIAKNFSSIVNCDWIEIDSCKNSIINYESTFNLNNSRILNSNRLGVSNLDGKMKLKNSILRKNYAFGMINSSGDMDMTNCVVDSNSLGGILIAGQGLNKVDFSTISYNKGSQIEITDYKINILVNGSMNSPFDGIPSIKINNNNIIGDTASYIIDTAALFYLADIEKLLYFPGFSYGNVSERNSSIVLKSTIGRTLGIFVNASMVNKDLGHWPCYMDISNKCGSINKTLTHYNDSFDSDDWMYFDSYLYKKDCNERDLVISFNTKGKSDHPFYYFLSREKLKAKYFLGGKLIFNSIKDDSGYKFDFKNNNYNLPILTKMFQDDSYMIDYTGYAISIIPNSGLNSIFKEFENKQLPMNYLTADSGKDTLCENSSKLTVTKIYNATYNWFLNGNLITTNQNNSYNPIISGIWKCEISSTNCNFTTIQRKIILVKNEMLVSGIQTVCKGDSIKLGIKNVDYFTVGDLKFSNEYKYLPSKTELKTLVGYKNGCALKKDLNIIVNPLPTPTISPAPSVILCNGGSVDFTASNAVSYLWSTGEKTKTIKVSKEGTYNVQVVDTNGCSNTSSNTTIILKDVQSIDIYLNDNLITDSEVPICSGQEIILHATNINSINWDNGIYDNKPFTLNTLTKITVTGVDLNGCVLKKSLTLNPNAVNTNKPFSVLINNKTINSDTILCKNDEISLSTFNLKNVLWDNNIVENKSFKILSTNSYTVTGVDLNGCKKTKSIRIEVKDLPLVKINSLKQNICPGDSLQISAQGAQTYVWDNNYMNNSFIRFFSNSILKVTGYDQNNCKNTDSLYITVKSTQTIKANVSKQNICPGESITFYGTGANSFLWSDNIQNGIPYTVTKTKKYYVSFLNTNGCYSYDSIEVFVDVLPVIQISTTNLIDNKNICEGNETTLTAIGAKKIIWNGGVVNGEAFIPNKSQTYKVIGSNDLGCMDSAKITINIIPKLKIQVIQSPTNLCPNQNVTLFVSGEGSTWFNIYQSSNPSNYVVNGTAFKPVADVYQIAGLDSYGCITYKDYEIKINPVPNISIIKNKEKYCYNDTVILTATGAKDYVWDNGVFNGKPFIINSSKTFKIQAVSEYGCVSNLSTSIIVNPLPNVEISVNGPLNYCNTKPSEIIATSGFKYLWNDGSNTQTLKPLKSGVYFVKVTDNKGCSAISKSIELTVNECAGIEDSESLSHIKIYPNPTSGQITLEMPENYNNSEIKIFDDNGRLVYNTFVYQTINYFDFKRFNSGVYYLKVNDSVVKMIVE
jgi:hypothetical protein